MRGQRVFACEKDREPLVPRRLEANVRVDVAKGQAPQRVEDEAELRRRPAHALVLLEAPLQSRHARSEIERGFRIEVVERTRDDVAQALDLGVGVDEPGFAKTRVQIGQRALAYASQVKIAARREADRAGAAGDRALRNRHGLIERQPRSQRPHASDEPVAGLHRPQSPGTPTLAARDFGA